MPTVIMCFQQSNIGGNVATHCTHVQTNLKRDPHIAHILVLCACMYSLHTGVRLYSLIITHIIGVVLGVVGQLDDAVGALSKKAKRPISTRKALFEGLSLLTYGYASYTTTSDALIISPAWQLFCLHFLHHEGTPHTYNKVTQKGYF